VMIVNDLMIVKTLDDTRSRNTHDLMTCISWLAGLWWSQDCQDCQDCHGCSRLSRLPWLFKIVKTSGNTHDLGNVSWLSILLWVCHGSEDSWRLSGIGIPRVIRWLPRLLEWCWMLRNTHDCWRMKNEEWLLANEECVGVSWPQDPGIWRMENVQDPWMSQPQYSLYSDENQEYIVYAMISWSHGARIVGNVRKMSRLFMTLGNMAWMSWHAGMMIDQDWQEYAMSLRNDQDLWCQDCWWLSGIWMAVEDCGRPLLNMSWCHDLMTPSLECQDSQEYVKTLRNMPWLLKNVWDSDDCMTLMIAWLPVAFQDISRVFGDSDDPRTCRNVAGILGMSGRQEHLKAFETPRIVMVVMIVMIARRISRPMISRQQDYSGSRE
jgi:hypothetical protein